MATKEEIIDDNRYINVEDEYWYDDIISKFIFKMMCRGINLEEDDIDHPTMGFCSQGDGCRFTTNDFDWDIFAEKHNLYEWEWLEAAHKAGMEPFIKMSKSNNTGYIHEGTVWAELGFEYSAHELLPSDVGEEDIRYAAATVIQDQVDYHNDHDVSQHITEWLAGYMRELYNDLDALYYELIDDDAVWDTLEANNPEYIAEELDDESDSDEED